jgi:hypothetical protein
VLDAIGAEKMGIPAAAVITAAFIPTARAAAKLGGIPGYPCAVIAHPIASDTEEALRAKAEQIVHQCVTILSEPRPREGEPLPSPSGRASG